MIYEQHLAAARAMSDQQKRETLQELALDPRFAAVVALALDGIDQTTRASCSAGYAEHHGTLAHAAGGVFAYTVLEGKLKAACKPARKTGEKPPEES